MNYRFKYRDQIFNVALEDSHEKEQYKVDIGKKHYLVNVNRISSNCLSLIVQNQSFQIYIAENEGMLYISVLGEEYCIDSLDENEDHEIPQKSISAGKEKELKITAPMPGSLIKVDVKEGDIVKKGQCLAIIEAMKMETGLHATFDGKVTRIYAARDQQVDAGDILIELEKIS